MPLWDASPIDSPASQQPLPTMLPIPTAIWLLITALWCNLAGMWFRSSEVVEGVMDGRLMDLHLPTAIWLLITALWCNLAGKWFRSSEVVEGVMDGRLMDLHLYPSTLSRDRALRE